MQCPRRAENPLSFKTFPGEDAYGSDDCCSYCGSLHPDIFMARLEAGDIKLASTDKTYKVYVSNDGGEPFKYAGAPKFYFQHLTENQMRRFVDIFNERKIKFEDDLGFYVYPFFMSRQ